MFRKTLTIRALTPVHVGSGNNLHQIDFLQESDRFSRYDWDRLIDFLIEKGLMAEFKEFLKGKELKNLTDVKEFLKDKGLELPEEALLYSIPFSCTGGPSQVEEFIKVSGKVYLPGSELKGSLRRALLLYALEEDDDLFSSFKNKLERELLNPRLSNKKFIKKVLNGINTFLEDAVFRPFGGGPHGDLLKFVSFSDSSFSNPEEVLEVKKVQIFKLSSGEGCSSLKERQKRGSSVCSEVVRQGVEFKVLFNFRLKQFLSFKEKGAGLFKKNSRTGNKSKSVLELFRSSGEETLEGLLKAWSKAEELSIEADKTLKKLPGRERPGAPQRELPNPAGQARGLPLYDRYAGPFKKGRGGALYESGAEVRPWKGPEPNFPENQKVCGK